VRPPSATSSDDPAQSRLTTGRMYTALVWAGMRRYATYRQSLLAATFTNSVFGYLRCFVILSAAAGAGRVVSGYTPDRLATYVWAGQGLIGTVLLWQPPDLADRIRSGDVVTDLLRPVDPVWHELATNVGQAVYQSLTRFAVPVLVGALTFDLYAPRNAVTYPLFAVSVVLAMLVCFGCRYLVAACTYWTLDVRGPNILWAVISMALTGLSFPLWFLPDALAVGIVVGTPFGSIIQVPLDVLTERGSLTDHLGLVCVQGMWAAVMIGAARWVQRRAERRLVIQGG